MDDSRLADLYGAFRNFCEQIYKVRVYDETNVRDLFNVLSEIHKAAWYLPLEFPDDGGTTTLHLIEKLRSEMPESSPTYHLYHIFEETGIKIDLSKRKDIDVDAVKGLIGGPFDGLYYVIRDIYDEITNGMLLYEHGYTKYAFWDWSIGFHFHWGRSIRDAIARLHKICQLLQI